MEIKIIKEDDKIIYIRLSNVLDIKGVEEAELKFTIYTSSRLKPDLIELSDLEFISSLGLKMLLINAKTLSKKSSKLVMLNL